MNADKGFFFKPTVPNNKCILVKKTPAAGIRRERKCGVGEI
jgi:hypothetical protein